MFAFFSQFLLQPEIEYEQWFKAFISCYSMNIDNHMNNL